MRLPDHRIRTLCNSLCDELAAIDSRIRELEKEKNQGGES